MGNIFEKTQTRSGKLKLIPRHRIPFKEFTPQQYNTWYQVPVEYLASTWYQVLGTRYLEPGVWYQAPGSTHQVSGTLVFCNALSEMRCANITM